MQYSVFMKERAYQNVLADFFHLFWRAPTSIGSYVASNHDRVPRVQHRKMSVPHICVVSVPVSVFVRHRLKVKEGNLCRPHPNSLFYCLVELERENKKPSLNSCSLNALIKPNFIILSKWPCLYMLHGHDTGHDTDPVTHFSKKAGHLKEHLWKIANWFI